MNQLLVLAYGNPLRGDDGVAWHIAQALGKKLRDPATDIGIFHQLTPELAERVSLADSVIFLDADVGSPPGQISLEPVYASPWDSSAWTHSLTPSSLLALSRVLYGKSPARALLLTVGGSSFQFAADLSAPVQQAIPEAVKKLVQLVRSAECKEERENWLGMLQDSSN